MTEILIKNGFVATMDRQRTVYRRGNVYIQDNRIVEVGEAGTARPYQCGALRHPPHAAREGDCSDV